MGVTGDLSLPPSEESGSDLPADSGELGLSSRWSAPSCFPRSQGLGGPGRVRVTIVSCLLCRLYVTFPTFRAITALSYLYCDPPQGAGDLASDSHFLLLTMHLQTQAKPASSHQRTDTSWGQGVWHYSRSWSWDQSARRPGRPRPGSISDA